MKQDIKDKIGILLNLYLSSVRDETENVYSFESP